MSIKLSKLICKHWSLIYINQLNKYGQNILIFKKIFLNLFKKKRQIMEKGSHTL